MVRPAAFTKGVQNKEAALKTFGRTELTDVQRQVDRLLTLRLEFPFTQSDETELHDLYRRERQLLGLGPV